MITVLLELRNEDPSALGTTLASLVPAAVGGYVREVVVLDASLAFGARHVAEEAGCVVRPAQELAEAVSEAKGEWLALFETGCELQPAWAEGISRRTQSISSAERGLRFRTGRWALSDLLGVSRSRRLAHGVVARREVLERRFRIGMRLSDLAASIPTDPLDQRIVTAAGRSRG